MASDVPPVAHPDPVKCPECREPAPYHGFCCPESLPPRSRWNVQDLDILFGSADETVIPFRGSPFAKAFDRNLVKSRLAFHPSAMELDKYPVVYRHTTPTAGRRDSMILAGHHRSTGALLQGRTVLARVIEGPVRAKWVQA